MQDFIKINKDDNVAVALKPIAKGTTVDVAGSSVTHRLTLRLADGFIHITSRLLSVSFLIIPTILKGTRMLSLQTRLILRAT